MVGAGGVVRQWDVVNIAVGVHLFGGLRRCGNQPRAFHGGRDRKKIVEKLAVVFVVIRKRRSGEMA